MTASFLDPLGQKPLKVKGTVKVCSHQWVLLFFFLVAPKLHITSTVIFRIWSHQSENPLTLWVRKVPTSLSLLCGMFELLKVVDSSKRKVWSTAKHSLNQYGVAVDELRSLVDTQTYLNLLRSLTALNRQADSHTVSVNRIIFTVWWTPSTWMNGVGVGFRKAHRIYRKFWIIFPICIRGALKREIKSFKTSTPSLRGPSCRKSQRDWWQAQEIIRLIKNLSQPAKRKYLCDRSKINWASAYLFDGYKTIHCTASPMKRLLCCSVVHRRMPRCQG